MSHNPAKIVTVAGKTLTVSNTLTLSGTDSSSVAFGAGGTVVYSGGNSNITSLTGLTGAISAPTTISMANGGVMRTTTTTAHTMSLQGYDVDGAAYTDIVKITNSNTPALSLTPTGALTVTAGATSTWNLTAGNLNIDAAAGNVNIGGTATSQVVLGRAAGAVAIQGQLNLSANVDLTTSVGVSDLDFSLSTGASWLPTGNVSWTGASNKTISLTSSGASGTISIVATSAAMTLTAGASSTFSTSSGSMNISGASGVNIQQSGVSYVSISSTTLQLGSGIDLSAVGGVSDISFGSSTGATTLPTGNVSWTGASGKNVTLTTTGAGAITLTSAAGIKFLGTAPSAAADTVGFGVADINGATTAALVTVYEGGGTITKRLNSNNAVKIMEIAESLADTGTIALPVPTSLGFLILSTQSGIGAMFSIDTSSNVGQCSANTSMSNADTGGLLCVYNNGGVPTIKNNLGGSRFIFATYKYV